MEKGGMVQYGTEDKRGDKGETNYYWLHSPPCPGDIVVDTDNKNVREIVREIKKRIDAEDY